MGKACLGAGGMVKFRGIDPVRKEIFPANDSSSVRINHQRGFKQLAIELIFHVDQAGIYLAEDDRAIDQSLAEGFRWEFTSRRLECLGKSEVVGKEILINPGRNGRAGDREF